MRQEMLEFETEFKGNLKEEMQLFNTVFKKISEEFKTSIGKEKFDKNSIQLLEKLLRSVNKKTIKIKLI